jgi:hypothetical protein
LVQAEGEVETLGVVVAASVLDGEGLASEPLHRILLRVALGDSQWFEFLWEEEVAKSRAGKAGKPLLSPAVADFFRRSSSIFWRAS